MRETRFNPKWDHYHPSFYQRNDKTYVPWQEMTAGEMRDKLKSRDTQLLHNGTKKELIKLIEHLNGSHLAGWGQCWAYLLNLEALKAGNMREIFPFKKFHSFPRRLDELFGIFRCPSLKP
jgi:hypothetical protein